MICKHKTDGYVNIMELCEAYELLFERTCGGGMAMCASCHAM
jgi:hypothetical protein